MSEWNHDILVENVRSLLKRKGMTQQQLAEVTGMTQANVSKALNPNDKRNFSLEQVISISQHFGVSIDELVGNKVPLETATSPRSVLAFLSELLSSVKMRSTTISEEELIYEQFQNEGFAHLLIAGNLAVLFLYNTPDQCIQGLIAADEGTEDIVFLRGLLREIRNIKDDDPRMIGRFGAPSGMELIAVGNQNIAGAGVKMLLTKMEIRFAFYNIMDLDVLMPVVQEDHTGRIPQIMADLDRKFLISQCFALIQIKFRHGHHLVCAVYL